MGNFIRQTRKKDFIAAKLLNGVGKVRKRRRR